MSLNATHQVTFAPLVEACKAHGISRTVAFSMIQGSEPLLASFLIGKRRYVYIESLQTLPQRLAKRGESNEHP